VERWVSARRLYPPYVLFKFFAVFATNSPNPNLSLLKLRQDLFGEESNVLRRHLLRHAAEMKCAGDRRQAVRFAPSADRVGYPLRIPRLG
jgi:hypothetical protein